MSLSIYRNVLTLARVGVLSWSRGLGALGAAGGLDLPVVGKHRRQL